MKIKSTQLDKLFSRYIRLRDRHCQWCGRADGKLECSHIFGRRNHQIRWDPLNAKLLCFACHRYWHENPLEAQAWVIEYLGEENVELLRQRSRAPERLRELDKREIKKNLESWIESIENEGLV